MLSTILWTDPRTDLSSFWWKKCGNENSISFFFIFYKGRKHFISSWLYCVCVFVSHLVCVLFVFMCSWSGCYLCSTISKLYRTWNTQLLILSLLFFFSLVSCSVYLCRENRNREIWLLLTVGINSPKNRTSQNNKWQNKKKDKWRL